MVICMVYLNTIAESCQQLTKCGCKTECHGRCKCFWFTLPCTVHVHVIVRNELYDQELFVPTVINTTIMLFEHIFGVHLYEFFLHVSIAIFSCTIVFLIQEYFMASILTKWRSLLDFLWLMCFFNHIVP